MNPMTDSLRILSSTGNYNRWIFDNIKEFIGPNVLEIGSGTGNMTDYIIQKSISLTGIELDRECASLSRKKYKDNRRVKIVNGDFIKLKIKKSHYDTVVSLNVLEHIKNDSFAVKKMAYALKKGGIAVNFVPAMHFAYGALDKECGHFRRYEKADMEKLYRENGLIIEKISYHNFIGVFAWALNSRLLSRKIFPRNQTLIFDRLFVPILKQIEAVIPPPIGQSLIVVGKKI